MDLFWVGKFLSGSIERLYVEKNGRFQVTFQVDVGIVFGRGQGQYPLQEGGRVGGGGASLHSGNSI